MYLLLIVLGIITFVHSVLFIIVIQKNAEITNKLNQITRKKTYSKANEQPFTSKKEITRRDKRATDKRIIDETRK